MKTNRSDDDDDDDDGDDDACKKRKRPLFVKCWFNIMGGFRKPWFAPPPPPFVSDISFDVITLRLNPKPSLVI